MDHEHQRDGLFQPLPDADSIRCLELQPGEENQPLVVALFVVRLDDAEKTAKFDAISYVWGSPDLQQHIECNGRFHGITANLADALRQVRHRDKPRVLWADQICINQGDLQEKAHQVSLMSKIYKLSNRTLICLGYNDARHSPLATGVLDDAYGFIQDIFGRIDMSPDSFPFLEHNHQLFSDERWASFAVLLQQPWFNRGWVVQEAALGTDVRVLWGGTEIEWLNLLEVYQWLIHKAPRLSERHPGATLSNLFTGAFAFHRYEHAVALLPHVEVPNEQRADILDVLFAASQLSLTDPRDRVFAFLGLRTLPLTQELLATYPIEYEKPYLDTYHDFATNYLRVTSDLDILSYVQSSEATLNGDHSSWFPRWNCSCNSYPCIRGGWPRIRPERKSVRVSVDSDDQVIGVKGVIFDSVSFCSQVFDITSTQVDDITRLWHTVEKLNSAEDNQIYAPQTMRAFIQTLTRTFGFGTEGKSDYYTALYQQRLQEPGGQTVSLQKDKDVLTDDIEYFHRRLLSNSADGRKFITLGHGHFGNAPSATEPGDLCCILYGAKTPFVIRKTSRHGFYKFVGAVYIPSAGQQPRSGSSNFQRYGSILEEHCEDWKAREYEEAEILLC